MADPAGHLLYNRRASALDYLLICNCLAKQWQSFPQPHLTEAINAQGDFLFLHLASLAMLVLGICDRRCIASVHQKVRFAGRLCLLYSKTINILLKHGECFPYLKLKKFHLRQTLDFQERWRLFTGLYQHWIFFFFFNLNTLWLNAKALAETADLLHDYSLWPAEKP